VAYSILSEARIAGSVSEQGDSRAYSVFWSENANLQDWTTFIGMDIVGSWNGFLFATQASPNTSTSHIGPTSGFPPVDALNNNTIFFRLKYDKHPKNPNPTNKGKIQWITESDPIFNDDKSIEFDLISDGKWTFYEIDMNLAPQWVGLVTNIRFFPAVNGFRNDEFFLNFFEIGSTDLPFGFENERAGRPGKATGAMGLVGEIAIEKDVNDRLIVNIDGYGDVQVTLTPQIQQPEAIARDLSFQLGKVAIGGYIRAQARIDQDTKQMIIESGTRANDSSVRISDGPNSAAATLGFTDAVGFFIGTVENGADPAFDYNPISAYRPTTLEILSLFDNDSNLASVSLNPQSRVVEAGRRDFGLTGRRLRTEITVEGRGTNFTSNSISTQGALNAEAKTFIDINHPFTDDGKLLTVFFNGISDTEGGSKWKIFRPSLDGTLTLVDEGVIGKTDIVQNPSGGLVLSVEPGVFSADLTTADVKVRRGDLLGIYNVSMHVGAGGTRKPDAMYYEIEGDVQGTITPPASTGAGEAGLPIYAIGNSTRSQAVLDIDLQRRLNIDKLRVHGNENSRDLEYNIGVASSTVYSADIPGNHVICFVVNPVFGTRDCFERPNQAFNIQALNDDILLARNGITSFGSPGTAGLGGANTDGVTYFYVNGDAEHLGVLEFVGLDPLRFDFFRDPIAIDCVFSQSNPPLDKPIGRAAMYFKDRKNQRSWQIEYQLRSGAKGGNGSKAGFQLIPSESITAVILDNNKRIERFQGIFLTQKTASNLQTALLENPVVLDVVTQDGTRNPQQGIDFQQSVSELGGTNLREQATFIEFQWSKFEWEFETIRTPAFRWFSDFHWSTKITEFQVFGVSQSFESLGDNIQVLFSADGQTFTTAGLIRSSDSDAEYKIGNSPQFIRLVFRPTIDLTITDVLVDFEEDQVCFGAEGRDGSSGPLVESKVGGVSEATVLPITNSTGQTADLILDLPADVETSRQLMYFSKLHSIDDILTPQIGSPGRVDFIENKRLNEEENVAINAKAYGLRSLASGTMSFSVVQNTDGSFIFPNHKNRNFELGSLEGYRLTVVQSGSETPFQVPRVFDGLVGVESDPAGSDVQVSSFIFGHNMDNRIPATLIDFSDSLNKIVPVEYIFSTEVADLHEFAENIDLGSAQIEINLKYVATYTPQLSTPILRILGSPTISGIEAPSGHIVDADYGSNLLQQQILPQTPNAISSPADTNMSTFVRLKPNTRFIRSEIFVDAQGARAASAGFSTILVNKFLLGQFRHSLRLIDTGAVKWYKSWRTGIGDFTDSHFDPVTNFTTITGSTHWYQPFDGAATSNPTGNQSIGFSEAFTGIRNTGIQGFRRMSLSDPGILGGQWSGEKKIVGFRAVMQDVITTAECSYPRKFHLEALKTRDELEIEFGPGVSPDINNEAHFKFLQSYRTMGPFGSISNLLGGPVAGTVPRGISGPIITVLLDVPVITEGIRMVITTNCDRWEVEFWDTNGNGSVTDDEFINMNAVATCPDNFLFTATDGFFCSQPNPIGMWQPLEAPGNTSLPIDDVIDWLNRGTSSIHFAVDLGRHHDLELNTDLFELVADAVSQSKFNVASAVFGDEDTGDVNQVTWNGSSSFARWIRFSTPSEFRWEDPNQISTFSDSTTNIWSVVNRPQSFLRQARIYPRIQTSLIPTKGFNCSWDDLGKVITDNNNSTFINYSDYPVVAIDLGKAYLLSNESTVFRKKHDLIAGTPIQNIGDRRYWNPDDDSLFTYATKSFKATGNPLQVEFETFGAPPPDVAVRWVSFRGDGPLQITSDVGPKDYNFRTPGGRLMNSAWKPRNPESFTENFSWFTTRQVGLKDISTFFFDKGNNFSASKDLDYGANLENFGDPYNAFDGRFNANEGDVWGVQIRDIVTGLEDPNNALPHIIWRVFRDNFRGDTQFKNIIGFKIQGFSDLFFPTDFTVQKLRDSIELPQGRTADELDASRRLLLDNNSWENFSENSFTGVDSYQDGVGFSFIFTEPVITRGLRFVITGNEYPDDSVETQVSDTGTGQRQTLGTSAGPQTRVREVVVYEQAVEEATTIGEIEINHSLSATFASTTQVPGRSPDLMKDGRIDTFWQSTGFSDTISITLPEPRPISMLRWIFDPNIGRQTGRLSTNAPATFQLRGIGPNGQETLLRFDNYIGTTFSGTLSGTLDQAGAFTSDTFFFDVFSVQGQEEQADSIIISELELIQKEVLETSLVQITGVLDRHPNSPNLSSTLITYSPNTDAVAKVFMDGIDGNNDALFSERDFFQFYLKINDVSLLDKTFGTIKLGNSNEVFYGWDLADIAHDLQNGWNTIRLQFKTAPEKSEKPFRGGADFDPDFGQSRVDFITADAEVTASVDGVTSQRVIQSPGIRYFEFEFRGNNGSEALQFTVDDFRFVRNKFEDVCRFEPSLYLNNSETFLISLEGVDIAAGTVEFWLRPDWNVAGILRGNTSVMPALFRIIRPDNSFLSFFYRPNTGFVAMIFDGRELNQFESNILRDFRFQPDKPIHLALAWDAAGRASQSGATLAMYMNGEPFFGTSVSWREVRQGGAAVVVGGELGQRFAAGSHNSTALTFTAVPSLPIDNTASVWGVMENLKIYNYAKTDFSDINDPDITRRQLIMPSEMVQVSLDGSSWESAGSQNLPLVVQDVPAGNVVNAYIRTSIPKFGLTGDENRDASLLVRWKTPLRGCD